MSMELGEPKFWQLTCSCHPIWVTDPRLWGRVGTGMQGHSGGWMEDHRFNAGSTSHTALRKQLEALGLEPSGEEAPLNASWRQDHGTWDSR